MKLGATFSPCRKYRYTLWRIWRDDLPILVWLMLNPSTADETRDDPTIRKCIAWSMNMGYGGLIILNIFAYRSTQPINLVAGTKEPVGPENDAAILETLQKGVSVVCAWGKVIKCLEWRPRQVWEMLEPFREKLLCLKTNQDGSPQHPLYIAFKARPFKWEGNEKHAILKNKPGD